MEWPQFPLNSLSLVGPLGSLLALITTGSQLEENETIPEVGPTLGTPKGEHLVGKGDAESRRRLRFQESLAIPQLVIR